jgi:acyl-ACP thioesterase
MENYLDKKFELRNFEMTKRGVVSPTAILTLLEETAAEHSYNIGYSLYHLGQKNIGWVLISGAIDMIRYPKYKESITIRTWASKYTLVKGYRENIILDSTDTVIGKARGIWVFYDIEKMKPVPIFNEIKSKWGIYPEVSQEVDTDAIQVINEGEPRLEYDVYKSDVDSNNHVNNIRYFHWLIESLPDEITDTCVLKKITAKFCSEAKYGEKVRVYLKQEPALNIFSHTIKSSADNRVLAAAQTIWEQT